MSTEKIWVIQGPNDGYDGGGVDGDVNRIRIFWQLFDVILVFFYEDSFSVPVTWRKTYFFYISGDNFSQQRILIYVISTNKTNPL